MTGGWKIEKISGMAPQSKCHPVCTCLEDMGPFYVTWAGEQRNGESQALNNRLSGMKCSQSDSHSMEKNSSPKQREEWTVIHGMKCLCLIGAALVSPSPPLTKTLPCWNWNTQPGTWWRLTHKSSLRHSHGGTRCGKESWSCGGVCLVGSYRGWLTGFGEETSVKYH